MSLRQTLEKLERFGDSDADRSARPEPDRPAGPADLTAPGSGWGPDSAPAAGSASKSSSGSDPAAGSAPASGTAPASAWSVPATVAGAAATRSARRATWRRRLLVAAGAVLATALVVTWLVGWSPLLGVGSVRVDGIDPAAPGAVTASQVQAAADLADGSPLVRIDTDAVARRVEALPAVAHAVVAVEYPSTVRVTVTPRVPVLVLTDPARLVDAAGVAYLAIAGDPPTGLPVTSAAGSSLTVAAQLAGALPAVARALVARIDVTPQNTTTLRLTDGRVVDWGDPSRVGEKAQLLTALIAPTSGAALQVTGSRIDLTDPDVVTVR